MSGCATISSSDGYIYIYISDASISVLYQRDASNQTPLTVLTDQEPVAISQLASRSGKERIPGVGQAVPQMFGSEKTHALPASIVRQSPAQPSPLTVFPSSHAEFAILIKIRQSVSGTPERVRWNELSTCIHTHTRVVTRSKYIYVYIIVFSIIRVTVDGTFSLIQNAVSAHSEGT